MDEQIKKPSLEPEFYADTMELEKKKDDFMFMNKEKGIFAEGVSDGINRDRSIFDKTAVFHVGSNTDE